MTGLWSWRSPATGLVTVGAVSLALVGASTADDGQTAPAPAVQPEKPSSGGPVHDFDEAQARWNPKNDPSTVIKDNGNNTYTVVHTDR
ncbi:MAG: hypothetical protein ABIO67_08240 [Mycobacteriales bacterium]